MGESGVCWKETWFEKCMVMKTPTWDEWQEMKAFYFDIPEDNGCVREKDMEKCEIEGCENWCSTLTQCSIHAQMDMRRDNDGE